MHCCLFNYLEELDSDDKALRIELKNSILKHHLNFSGAWELLFLNIMKMEMTIQECI